MSNCGEYENLTSKEQIEFTENLLKNFDIATYAFQGLKAAILLAGISIIFIWKR